MLAVRPEFSSTLTLAAALVLGCFLPASLSRAQAASCTALPKPPDTLSKLAECCAASLESNPSCRAADPKEGYVILKDNAPDKLKAYLIIPTTKVTGIEDPLVSTTPVVDFWARGFALSAEYLGRPQADTALAINSVHARSQNQLHIHISCVRRDVKDALLATPVPSYPDKPVALPLPPDQHVYQVVKIGSLGGPLSPFRLIQEDPDAATAMGDQGIAIVGSPTGNEYFMLTTRYDNGNPASAEELLDQSCS